MGEMSISVVMGNLAASLTALVFCVVLCIFMRVMGRGRSERATRFNHLSGALVVGNIITCSAYFIRHADVVVCPNEASLFIHMLVFLANIFLTYFFARYIELYFGEKMAPGKRISNLNNIILLASFGLIVFYYFLRVSYLDESEGVVQLPTVLRMIIAYGIELYYMVYSFVFFLKRRKALDGRRYLTVLAGFVVVIGGVVLEAVNPSGILLNYAGAVLGQYLFYFGAETPDYEKLVNTMKELEKERDRADRANEELVQYAKRVEDFSLHDTMTGLGSKNAYMELIKRLGDDIRHGVAEFAVAVFDVNGLKVVNDHLGHECGDILLTDAGDALKETFGRENAYRLGGDEFIVVMEHCDAHDMINDFERFDRCIAEINKEQRPYKSELSVAKGYAVYESSVDRAYMDVFRRADNAMYSDKKGFYGD